MTGLGPGPLDPDVLAREIKKARAGTHRLSLHRGWWTFHDNEHVWRYQDTGELVGFVERAGPYGPFTDHNRPCAACREFGLPLVPPAAYEWSTDPCLGTLPGIFSACCGHGDDFNAQALDVTAYASISALGLDDPKGEVRLAQSHAAADWGVDLEGLRAFEWLRRAVLERDGHEHVGRPTDAAPRPPGRIPR